MTELLPNPAVVPMVRTQLGPNRQLPISSATCCHTLTHVKTKGDKAASRGSFATNWKFTSSGKQGLTSTRPVDAVFPLEEGRERFDASVL